MTQAWARNLREHATRLGRWSAAHAAIRLEEYLFDYVLYPLMLYQGGGAVLTAMLRLTGQKGNVPEAAGYWFGFALLVSASIAINLFYIRAYDRLQTDWFGFEALKGVTSRFAPKEGSRPLWRLVVRWATFVYLSTWHSPLFGTLFMRGSAQGYAMTRQDWKIFWSALLIANLGWTALVSGCVEIVRLLLP